MMTKLIFIKSCLINSVGVPCVASLECKPGFTSQVMCMILSSSKLLFEEYLVLLVYSDNLLLVASLLDLVPSSAK
jgi:hypothetical protein